AISAPGSIKASTARTLALCPWIKQPFNTAGPAAEARRLRGRIAELEALASRPEREHLVGDVRIVENVRENRVQVFFRGKPSDAVIRALRQRGFRWSPTAGAWQRHLGNAALWAAFYVVRPLTQPAEQA
ncbi:MAG: hypothetical protein K2X34_01145, partial [Hyphomonadaceae bacterium]|nr:hypothetical protein [Hyphomonadaceae bacterium]